MLAERGIDLSMTTIGELHGYLTELDEDIKVGIGLAIIAGETEIPDGIITEIRNCNAVINFINTNYWWAQNPNIPALFYQREWKLDYFRHEAESILAERISHEARSN